MECCMVKFGKRLCELSPISRWNPGRNSLTIQLQLGIPGPSPKLRKFGGLIEAIGDSAPGKEVTHTSPSVMQISVWPVIRLQAQGVCSHDSHYDGCPPYTIYLLPSVVIYECLMRCQLYYLVSHLCFVYRVSDFHLYNDMN